MADRYPSGAVQVAMMRTLIDCPSGESGFRKNEVSLAAVKKGWVKSTYESGRITWYAITEQGREAWKFGQETGKIDIPAKK